MSVFDKDFYKKIRQYKKTSAQNSIAENELIRKFTSLSKKDISTIITIIEKYGQPNAVKKMNDFKVKYNDGELNGEDIVIFEALADILEDYIARGTDVE